MVFLMLQVILTVIILIRNGNRAFGATINETISLHSNGLCINSIEICGTDSRVSCKIDLKTNETSCECDDFENLTYEKEQRICLSECDLNADYCGVNSGAVCVYDENKKETVCHCSSKSLVYYKDKQKCLNPCEENAYYCDTESGAICIYEYETGKIRCDCIDHFVYDSDMKKCINNGTGNTNICEKEQCENGGTCKSEDGINYECFCLENFTGKRCEMVELRKGYKENICGNVSCILEENKGSCYCYCEEGYYFNVKMKSCEVLGSCVRKLINGECNLPHEICSSGECHCEDGYRYSSGRNACIPDFCVMKYGISRCTKNMDCKESEGKYTCHCKNGFYRMNKECVKYDICSPGQLSCSQDCKDGRCICFKGFKEDDKGKDCVPVGDIENCDIDCSPGTCVKVREVEKCFCPTISHVFQNGTCVDKCTAGYVHRDECPDGCDPDDIYGYRCKCAGKYKYSEDGVHCENKHMCEDHSAKADCIRRGGLCEENFYLYDGYECRCRNGYEFVSDTCKHKCEKMSDYCLTKQSTCVLYADDIECSCPPLLVSWGSGQCNQLAKYSFTGDFMTPKSWHRNFEEGFEDLGEVPNYGKLRNEFDLAVGSILDAYRNSTLLKCMNEHEYWKCSFEIKLDEDPQEKLDLISNPSVCLPMADERHCLLPPNFVMKKTSKDIFRKTDPCGQDVKSRFCGEETECHILDPSHFGYRCKCKEGFQIRATMKPVNNITIELCEDINECLSSKSCPNTTKCLNFHGGYECTCKDGYRLKEGKPPNIYGCQEICNPNPCVHGSCEQTGNNGFFCNCEGKYFGRFCNETKVIDVVKPSRDKMIIWAIAACVTMIVVMVSVFCCYFLHRHLSKHTST